MDERNEELAALNALSMLESDEKRVLDGASLVDKELRDLTAELETTTAELARLITPVEPPANMKRRIREKLRSSGAKKFAPSAGTIIGTLGWALAAVLAMAAAWLWQERSKLTNQVAAASKIFAPATPSAAEPAAAKEAPPTRSLEDEVKKLQSDFAAKESALKTEVEALKKRETDALTRVTQLTGEVDALKKQEAESQLQMTILQSKVWEYRRSEMLVVWDAKRRQGLVMLDKMPRPESGQDYQLWIVDPGKPAHVSGGVVTVDSKGTVKAPFKATEEVAAEGIKFALSLEKKGGVPKAEGPMIFVP